MLSKALNPLLDIVRFHKKKLLLLFVMYSFFVYLFFYFSDLGDFLATKISTATQGQIFIDFDKLDLSLIPQPALALHNVSVENPVTPPLSAQYVSLSPSILGLITFKPGVKVQTEGFFGGDVNVVTRGGEKSTQNTTKTRVNADFEELNLGQLTETLGSPVKVEGVGSGVMETQVDTDFSDQPDVTLAFQIEKALIAQGSIMTPLGPIDLPRLSMGSIVLNAHGEKGSYEVSKFNVGKPGSDLIAQVTGRADVHISKYGSNIVPQLGSYDFSVHLSLSDAARSKLSAFLGILQSYQSAGGGYAFRISAASANSQPSLTRIQ